MSDPVELTLFVNGASEFSARAIVDARRLCDDHLGPDCRLSIVDLHSDPDAGRPGAVVVTPTLVRTRPLPERTIVGDISDSAKSLLALELAGG
ncbi:MAG: circadian clock protein KaiB [Solirubrobacteraceae bacterium]|jgi:circadian clock protein KaiB|nr:circadian clock protein KaiB [Solirubrobacteraceae bacterium]